MKEKRFTAEFWGEPLETARCNGKAVGCSRQRLECVRFHRRFGFGAQAAVGRGWACRGEGKAVLQAHALQTLARLLTSRLEPSVSVLPEFRDEPKKKPGAAVAIFSRIRPRGTVYHLRSWRIRECSRGTDGHATESVRAAGEKSRCCRGRDERVPARAPGAGGQEGVTSRSTVPRSERSAPPTSGSG